jgi:anti-sigma B factor antagonist
MPFDLKLRRHGPYTVVRLTGELDIETSPQVRDCFDRLVEQGHVAIEVDLSGLTYCDSTGLSAFVHGLQRCRAGGGWMRVGGETGPVARILELTGLRGFLHHDGTERAVAIRSA